MGIRARVIIISLSVVLHYCLTKTSELTFIVFHHVRLEYFQMFVKTSVSALPWHENVNSFVLTVFIPCPLRKFRLTLSFFDWWLWHLSVLTLYHLLSADYVRVQNVHFWLFLLCIYAVSCPLSSCIHAGFYSYSLCIHFVFDLSFFWANLNQISNTTDLGNYWDDYKDKQFSQTWKCNKQLYGVTKKDQWISPMGILPLRPTIKSHNSS